MTISPQNANSALKMLERALAYSRETSIPAAKRLFALEIQIDSVRKCMAGLIAQIETLESAKVTGRALLIENEDGSHTRIDGQLVEAIALTLPEEPKPVIAYGKPDALRTLAEALANTAKSDSSAVNGPAPLAELAREMARTAVPGFEPEVGP